MISKNRRLCAKRAMPLILAATLSMGVTAGMAPKKAEAAPANNGYSDTLSVRRNGNIYHFKNSIAGGDPDIVISYGKTDDEALFGDWDGDGTDTIGVRRGNVFYLKNSICGGDADIVVAYGSPGDQFLVGDWDGNGTDTIAIRRGGAYYIKNSLTGGDADAVIAYGNGSDTALAGDWDGNGTDTIAVKRGSTYFIKNTLAPGDADGAIIYGQASDKAYAGDWNGDGVDTLTVRRGREYYIKNTIATGDADYVSVYGKESDEAQAGNWGGATGDISLAYIPSQGQQVADYACQFIGNPYVWGGTSLTNGCDCSGFVMSVYAHFGVSLPHSSSALRSVGYGVSYSDAEPGDIICYSGHVGIYVGDGQIVNASNSKPYPQGGIKYSSATYKTILAVRRIF